MFIGEFNNMNKTWQECDIYDRYAANVICLLTPSPRAALRSPVAINLPRHRRPLQHRPVIGNGRRTDDHYKAHTQPRTLMLMLIKVK